MRRWLSNIMTLMLPILLLCRSNIAAQTLPLAKEDKARIINEEFNQQAVAAKPAPLKETRVCEVETQLQEKDIRREDAILNNLLPAEFETRVTLRSEKLPLKAIIRLLAESGGFNVIYGAGVDEAKDTSIDVNDVELWRALNTLLFPLGYSFKVENKDVIILAAETKTFKVLLPPFRQSFSDTVSNASFNGSQSDSTANQKLQDVKVGSKVIVETKLDGIDFWQEIQAGVGKFISANGSYAVNRAAGVVTVTDTPAVLDKLTGYFLLINQQISRQVLVDVKVVEVRLNQAHSYGVDWSIIQESIKKINNLSLTSNFGSQNITDGAMGIFSIAGPHPGSGITAAGFNAVTRLLETQGKVEVVSQPKLLLLNNQVGVIQVGTTTAYLDQSQIETLQGGNTIATVSTNQVQEGVTMRLSANLVGENNIYLSLSPVVTTVDQIRQIVSGTTKIEAPKTTTKSLNTVVKAKDGQTIVIGGLITSRIENADSGIPGINKIPVLKYLFGFRSGSAAKTELIIFITPKKA